jgi:type III secretory pathway component EscR
MKNLDWETLLIPVLMIGSLFLVILLGFGTDAYREYLNAYNTQQDREMFLKSYELVVECRKDASLVSIDKVCGELPTFISSVE